MTPQSSYVIDTSVAIKWIVDEEDSDLALALHSEDMLAPALLRIETANVLRTLVAKQLADAAAATDLFRFFQSAPLVIVDHDDDLEQRALELALELGHPVYDCVYLALAERTQRTLITADKRFLRALADTPYATRGQALKELPAT